MQPPESTRQRLELGHTDQATLEDIEHSIALATTTTEIEKGYFVSTRIIGTILSLGLALSASYWAFSPPAAVLQEINADIGPSNNASLFTIVWTISCAIGTLLFGRLSDKFGRRWFVVGSSCVAIVGAIIAATAKNMNTLIGANVLLGLPAGVHTCYGLTVGEVVPNKWKFVGIAIAALSNVIPNGFGAYLGLRLVHYYNWRYIYYIFIPCMFLVAILQFIFYRPPTFQQLHGSRTIKEELRRVDFIGIFLGVTGVVLFLLGVSWGGQPLPWTSPTILALLIVGGCVTIIFVFWEIYGGQPNPIVPMHFFKDLRGFVCATILCCVGAITYLALAIIWPSQVARIYGSTASSWQTTAWLSVGYINVGGGLADTKKTTIAFGGYGGFLLWGPFITIIKHSRLQMIFAVSMMVAFTGALASCNPSNLGAGAAFSFLAGFPSAWLELVSVLLVQMETQDMDLGTVYAIIFSVRAVAASIMTPVYLAILESKTKAMLLKYIPEAVTKAGLPDSSVADLLQAIAAGGTPKMLAKVPGMTPAVEQALVPALSHAYAKAYAYIYYAAIAVGGIGLIASICIRDYDQYFTDHVPRQIYKISDKQEDPLSGHEMHKSVEMGDRTESWVETRRASNDSTGPTTTVT